MERRDRAVRREGKKSLKRVGVNRLVPLHFPLATLVWALHRALLERRQGLGGVTEHIQLLVSSLSTATMV